jgi:hypothetical protein
MSITKSPERVTSGEVGRAAEEAAARAARDAAASRLRTDWSRRNRRCKCCGRFCGTQHRSIVYVAAIHRETGAEATWTLCPPCALAPDSSAEARALWRAWRRDAVVVAR